MLNFLRPRKKSNIELAERLFDYRTYQPYVFDCPDEEVKKICINCKTIQDSLNKVIEYCGPPNTPRSRYLYAIVYSYSNVLYNERAIYYLNLYLENGLYDYYCTTERKKELHLFEIYNFLIDCYLKDLKLDDALKCAINFLKLYPKNVNGYFNLANVYLKLNDIDKSIEILDKISNLSLDKYEKERLERKKEDYLNKKKKKYIYKPVKKDRIRINIEDDNTFVLE